MYKGFWSFTRRRFLVRDQRFGTACVAHHQSLNVIRRMMSEVKKRVNMTMYTLSPA
jgi:hypothetical protein